MKNDNSFQELDEQNLGVATAEFDAAVPPEGHRIRVDPDDLIQELGKSNDDFKRRQHEYATAPDAIREFMLLRGIQHASGYRFRAFPIPGTKRDAGDAGYASNHV